MNILKSNIGVLMMAITLIIVGCEAYEKELPQSEIFLNIEEAEYEVEIDSTLILSPKITYDYGSTYSWMLGGNEISVNRELEVTPTLLGNYLYSFSVSNNRGNITKDIAVQSMYNTTLEDLKSDDDTFKIDTDKSGVFTSHKLNFAYESEPIYDNFNGFVYSNLYSSNSGIKLLYSAYNKPIAFKSGTFVVYSQKKDEYKGVITTTDNEDHLFKSISVNNTYYNYNMLKNGSTDGTIKAFGGNDGKDMDWFKLTIVGFNKSGTQRGYVEFLLADYTKESNKDDYIIKEWTTIDLIPLGHCERLEFHLTSSDVVDGKMRTPGYFCMDEIKIIE